LPPQDYSDDNSARIRRSPGYEMSFVGTPSYHTHSDSDGGRSEENTPDTPVSVWSLTKSRAQYVTTTARRRQGYPRYVPSAWCLSLFAHLFLQITLFKRGWGDLGD
jgi:hypothetical protein